MTLKHCTYENYTYTLHNNEEETDSEVYETEYEVDYKEFTKNEKVKQMYVVAFSDKYEILEKTAKAIIEEYDLWFMDEEIIEEMLKENMEELDDIFWEENDYE